MAIGLECHNTQWGKTQHAGKYFGTCLKEHLNVSIDKQQQRKASLVKLFTETEAFATVKLDGTNVGKVARTGEILGRRFKIDKDATTYIKTSLDAVKEANVDDLMEEMMEEIKVEDVDLIGFIVFGELMCNKIYDYEQTGLVETWQIFGAIVEDNSQEKNVLEKLLNAGYAARVKENDENGEGGNQIQVFMNKKFSSLATSFGLNVAPLAKGGSTIFEVVKANKEWMKKGDGEGIVMTVGDQENGYAIVKWKGAHEPQENADQQIKEGLVKLKEVDIDQRIKDLFSYINEVIDDTSLNQRVDKNIKKSKNKTDREKEMEKRKKNMIEAKQKERSINLAIKSALTKFDSPKVYVDKGDLEADQFIEMLTEEVMNDITDIESIESIRKRINKICLKHKTRP